MDKIIQFPSNKAIGEKEINALFNGLLKLVKKNAYEQVSNGLKSECSFATKTALTLSKELKVRDDVIDRLITENKKLKENIKNYLKQEVLADKIISSSK